MLGQYVVSDVPDAPQQKRQHDRVGIGEVQGCAVKYALPPPSSVSL
jgi:hypothetical protein